MGLGPLRLPQSAQHSGKPTWNLVGSLLKRTVVYEGLLFRFHVSLPECKRPRNKEELPAGDVAFRAGKQQLDVFAKPSRFICLVSHVAEMYVYMYMYLLMYIYIYT